MAECNASTVICRHQPPRSYGKQNHRITESQNSRGWKGPSGAGRGCWRWPATGEGDHNSWKRPYPRLPPAPGSSRARHPRACGAETRCFSFLEVATEHFSSVNIWLFIMHISHAYMIDLNHRSASCKPKRDGSEFQSSSLSDGALDSHPSRGGWAAAGWRTLLASFPLLFIIDWKGLSGWVGRVLRERTQRELCLIPAGCQEGFPPPCCHCSLWFMLSARLALARFHAPPLLFRLRKTEGPASLCFHGIKFGFGTGWDNPALPEGEAGGEVGGQHRRYFTGVWPSRLLYRADCSELGWGCG